jgi:hypothetical protein
MCYPGIILVLFWCFYVYIIVSLPFIDNYFCFAYYFISGILQVISKHLPLQKIVSSFFFEVETYSGILKL